MKDINVEITQKEHPINRYAVRNDGTGTISCPHCLKAIATYAKYKWQSKVAEEILENKDLAKNLLYYNSQLILELLELGAWESDISSIFHIRCKKHSAQQSFFDKSLKSNIFVSSLRREDDWLVISVDIENGKFEKIPFVRFITNEDGYWGNIAIFYKGQWFTFESREEHIQRINDIINSSETSDEVLQIMQKVLQ